MINEFNCRQATARLSLGDKRRAIDLDDLGIDDVARSIVANELDNRLVKLYWDGKWYEDIGIGDVVKYVPIQWMVVWLVVKRAMQARLTGVERYHIEQCLAAIGSTVGIDSL